MVHNLQQGMILRRKITVAALAISVVATAIAATYIWAYPRRGPTSDEFAVFAAFLSRLSTDGVERPALAETSSQLVAPPGEAWAPAELRPHPPEKAEASENFIRFCGSLCGRDFIKKNLRAWRLKPSSGVQFPFDIVPASAEPSPAEGGKRIVDVTRPGFDLLHHRAVFSYSYDCITGGTPEEDAVICVQYGDVLLEKVNGRWQISSYSAFVL